MDEFNLNHLKYKYLLLGDNSIVLNNIIERFTNGTYNEDINQELSASTIMPRMSYREGTFKNELVRMEIYSDNRITRNSLLNTIVDKNLKEFFKIFNAYILVYDITDRSTFNQLNEWMEIINQFKNDSDGYSDYDDGGNNIKIFLVGENCNRRSNRQISIDEGKEFAIKNGCSGFIEISTKENKNIDNLFIHLTDKLVNDYILRNNSIIGDNGKNIDKVFDPPKLSPIPKDSIFDTIFKIGVISVVAIGLSIFLKSK